MQESKYNILYVHIYNFCINFITLFAANNNEDRFDMTFKKNGFNNGNDEKKTSHLN
jgi:hypothetical protein